MLFVVPSVISALNFFLSPGEICLLVVTTVIIEQRQKAPFELVDGERMGTEG